MLDELRAQRPQAEYDTWLNETMLVNTDPDLAIVGTANICVREQLEHRYASTIAELLTAQLDRQMTVQEVLGLS